MRHPELSLSCSIVAATCVIGSFLCVVFQAEDAATWLMGGAVVSACFAAATKEK